MAAHAHQQFDRSRIPALPKTTADLLASRKTKSDRTLNDHVNDVHVILWENRDYRAALDAVHDSDAIEGSLSIDNMLAANMIREHARKNGNPFIKDKKLDTLVKSLNIVLRRYGISRKQRRQMIGGVSVPNEDGSSAE